MLSDRRTLITLAVLVILAAGIAWTWFGPATSSPAAVAPRQSAAARRASEQQEVPLPPAAGVKLSALASARAEPADANRNPFRFERPAAASPSARPTDGGAPGFVPKPAEPAAPAGPPPLPPIPLKFIGMVEKADGIKLAVLSPGEGRSPMHGREGDIIDGRYRILKIGTESIEMAYLDGRGRQTIRLTGQ